MRIILICIEWRPSGSDQKRVSIGRTLRELRKFYAEDFIGGVRVLVPITTSIATIYSIYAVLGKVFPSQYVHLYVVPKHDVTPCSLTKAELFFQWPLDIIQFLEDDLVSLYHRADGSVDDTDQNIYHMNEPKLNITRKCNIDEQSLRNASKKQLFAFGGSFDGLHVGHLMALHTLMSLVVRDSGSKLIAFGVSEDNVVRSKSNGDCARDFDFRLDSIVRAMSSFLKCSGFAPVETNKAESTLAEHIKEIGARYDTRLVRLWQIDERKQIGLVFTALDRGGIGVAAYSEIEVLVVSPETMKGAKYVNRVRIDSGLPGLTLCVCPLVLRPSDENVEVINGSVENKISSSDERELLSEVLERPELLQWLQNKSAEPLQLADDKVVTFVRNILLPVYHDEMLREEKNNEELTASPLEKGGSIRSGFVRPTDQNAKKKVDCRLARALSRLSSQQRLRALEFTSRTSVNSVNTG